MNNEIFTSMGALSRAKDIPLTHLKAAKILNCHGHSPSGRWLWVEFAPWYEANKGAILELITESEEETSNLGAWKDRLTKAKALIAEIELKEKQSKTLDKDKVIQLVKSISISQAIIFKNLSDTLPHKLLGCNITDIQTILQKEYALICELLQKPMKDWTN
jgi:hypothetical protein